MYYNETGPFLKPPGFYQPGGLYVNDKEIVTQIAQIAIAAPYTLA